MIAQASIDIAGQQGRSIGLTTVPLLNQPVVNAAGKSNMKELLRPGRTRSLLNKIAGGLGVRTFGAGYSTETTMPKRLATGIVGMGLGRVLPKFTNLKNALSASRALREMSASSAKFSGWRTPNLRPRTIDPVTGKPKKKSGSSTNKTGEEGLDITYGDMSDRKSKIFNDPWLISAGVTPTERGQVQLHGFTPAYEARTKGLEKTSNGVAKIPSDRLGEFGMGHIKTKAPYIEALPGDYIKQSQLFNDTLNTSASARDAWTPVTGADMTSLLLHLKSKGVRPAVARKIADRAAEVLNKKVLSHEGSMTEQQFGAILNQANVRALRSGYQPDMRPVTDHMGYDLHTRNRGLERTPFKDGVTKLDGYGGGDSVPALLEPGESVVTKTGTKGNQGALTLINAGYNIDEIMGFEKGIVGSAMAGARSEGFIGQGAFNKARAGGMSSPMAGMGIGMGMQGAGALLGGQAGTLLQVASILPMISMTPITKLTQAILGMGGALTKAGGAGKTLEIILKNVFKAGPLLIVSGIIAGIVIGVKKWTTELAENKREQTLLNGITKKGAAEAGIAYNNLSDSIKGVRDQLELARAGQLDTFNSQNMTGIKGITLSIKDLQEKIAAAKTSMPEFVGALNGLSKSQEDNKKTTIDMAQNWKAQFVAGGMSVSEATNEIYAIVKASDMANLAFETISNKGFQQIQDKASAASYMFKELSKNMNNLVGEDLGNALGNVVIGVDSAVKSLVGTTDINGEVITQQKAIETVMNKLNVKGQENKALLWNQIESLKNTHPELYKILNTTDTIRSTIAKWKILVADVNINLKNLTATEAEALAKFLELQDAAISAAENGKVGAKDGVDSLAKSGGLIKKLNSQILAGGKDAEKVATRTKDQITAEIKLIDKRIKKIQEEADARIKAIQKTQGAESYAIELKQAQLDLQSAIASGDKEAQVRAQLALTALQKRHESEMAISSIQDDAAEKTKALEEEKIKKQDEIDALNKKLVAAQTRSADVTITRDKVQGYQSSYEALVKRQGVNAEKLKSTPNDKAALAEQTAIAKAFTNLANAAATDIKGKDKDLAKAIKEAFTGTLVKENGSSMGGKIMPATHPKGSPTYKGPDLSVLNSDASKITNIIGKSNDILGEIRNILANQSGGKRNISVKSTDIDTFRKQGLTEKQIFKSNGDLADAVRTQIITKNSLKKNDTFDYNGVTYRVTGSGFLDTGAVRATPRALGGPFAAGQLIQVNDRINPLGAQQEGMMIRPDFSGIIYPNAATMPRYDVPSGGYSGYRNEYSGGSNGSAPVINNYITATPNMDIKQLAREVGMVTAKAVSRGGNNRGYSNGTPQVVNI